jgi:hypothetical protein
MQYRSIDVLFLAFGKFPFKNADFTSARKVRLSEPPEAASFGPSVSEIRILGNFS